MAAHITLSKSDTTDNGKTYEVKIKMTYYGNGVSWNSDNDCYGTITFNGTTSSKFYHTFTTSTSGQTMGTKTFTVTKKSSSQTLKATGKFVTGVSLGTLTDTLSITIPALTSYTVSYDANGGSGAPASQTKTQGVALTLSSTVPTRSGYTFMGWGTSSTATTASYQPGGTYSSNASITLYAVWSNATPTYVYFYNTGGSTLTYSASVGSTFTFPTPYRSGYTLSGWSTSSGGAVSRYGGETVTWTTSMPTTYYGIWYQSGGSTAPSIQSCSAVRSSGTYVSFTLNFTRGSGTTSVYLYTKTRSSSSYSLKKSWTSVTSSQVTASVSGYATNTEYDVRWEVRDSTYGSIYRYDVISGDSYLWKSNGTKLEVGVPLFVQGQQIVPYDPPEPVDYLKAHPVGSVMCMSTNTNPSTKIGGTWTLIDKEFKHQTVSNAFTRNTTNCTSIDAQNCVLSGHTITCYLGFTNKVKVADTALEMMYLGTSQEAGWNKLGITGSTPFLWRTAFYSDGGQAFAMVTCGGTEDGHYGRIVTVDAQPADIAAGSAIVGACVWTAATSSMLDSFCDRFYFKRTA